MRLLIPEGSNAESRGEGAGVGGETMGMYSVEDAGSSIAVVDEGRREELFAAEGVPQTVLVHTASKGLGTLPLGVQLMSVRWRCFEELWR